MLVVCQNCQSRYQLPDDKIRPTGTKVRCPKCQNTFRVFGKAEEKPEELTIEEPRDSFISSNEFSEKTEISPPTRPVRPPPVVASEIVASPFRNRTNETELSATARLDAPLDDEATRVARPFAQPGLPSVRPNLSEDSLDGITDDSASEDAARFSEFSKIQSAALSPSVKPNKPELEQTSAAATNTESEVRPFKDETFMEIQKAGGSSPSRFLSKKIIIAGSVIVAAVALFFLTSRVPEKKSLSVGTSERPAQAPSGEREAASSTTAPTTPIRVVLRRPTSWYKEQSAVFQDFLSQMAALPKIEQQKPEIRAVIAEALILNGTLTGADDQVATGLGYASGLLARSPDLNFGFYGLADYALWKWDLPMLADLLKRWPIDDQADPEYQLSKLVIDARVYNDLNRALEESRDLLQANPDFYRARYAILALSADAGDLAERILGERWITELRSTYKIAREAMKNIKLPPLFIEIDRRQARATPSDERISHAEPLTHDNKTNTIRDKKNKHLPKAGAALIASNTKIKKEQTEAEKFYQLGNSKMRDRQYSEALDAYQRALRLNPDLADIYKRVGQIHMVRKDRERAVKSFKIYLQLKPNSNDKQLVQGWINSLQ